MVVCYMKVLHILIGYRWVFQNSDILLLLCKFNNQCVAKDFELMQSV